ncbi:lipoprotein [Streptococcus pneumoniae]|nr:lipoprotein [Streptococcus pneumoniae]CGG75951.1 lipoprotein [Streptococcus pneumoniae]CJR29521.1 lipoprotein [Streptococcus pneumoniae]COH78026.1 lipoprotein [Streptococcus pneumoniae]COK29366.1 lipoprotein [Streptococcus pneumoniae]
MSQQVKNAHNLYIHAIQDGRVAEAQAQSVGDTYIQHSTGVPDGKKDLQPSLQISLSVIQSVRLRLSAPLRMAIWSLFMFINI